MVLGRLRKPILSGTSYLYNIANYVSFHNSIRTDDDVIIMVTFVEPKISTYTDIDC